MLFFQTIVNSHCYVRMQLNLFSDICHCKKNYYKINNGKTTAKHFCLENAQKKMISTEGLPHNPQERLRKSKN